MAQTKRKRTRKHRGTPAGTIERAGRTGRPRTAAEAKEIAAKRREERMNRPPSWRSSINRAAIAAIVFGALAVLLLPGNRSIGQGAVLAAMMFVLYIPLGYFTDTMIYRFRQRKRQQAR
jgi:hypothetical protein